MKSLPQIHQNILLLRKQKGFTQKQLAERLNMSESNYNRLENNEIDLAYERHLVPLAEVFGLSVEELFIYQSKQYMQIEQFETIKQAFNKLKDFFEK